jgi:hypothetical protein
VAISSTSPREEPGESPGRQPFDERAAGVNQSDGGVAGPRRHQSDRVDVDRARLKVRVARPWPRLPDGDYTGTVVGWGRGPAPWGKRTRRDGTKVVDHHVYVHVELESGATPALQGALDAYRREHAKPAVIYYACRFETTITGQPLPIGRASKLYELLQLLGGLTDEADVDLEEILDRSVRRWRLDVRVVTPADSRYRETRREPRPDGTFERRQIAIPKPERTATPSPATCFGLPLSALSPQP